MDALARPLLDNDHDGLVRALRERVVAAAGIIEDGTGGTPKHPARNLVDEYTKRGAGAARLPDTAAALAFFKRHPAASSRRLRAAVKLPPRPEYYGAAHGSLDRRRSRRRLVRPALRRERRTTSRSRARSTRASRCTSTYRGKQILLAKWRTTIGGWRAEQASDGYEYFRYKGSDVGPRVIRQIVSGPVWIAPPSTPIRSLVKGKIVHGTLDERRELRRARARATSRPTAWSPATSSMPGQNGRRDFDNGMRAHGSSDYLSMYSANGFSHGCHRLPNHLAIRLYSFILRHRHMRVVGDQPMDFARQFLEGRRVFEMRIPSRGYIYVLDPPLPVEVLEGDIKGEQKKPILGYVPKPGIKYPPGPPPPAPDAPKPRRAGPARPPPEVTSDLECGQASRVRWWRSRWSRSG